jgi:hypothetical protein
MARVHSTHRRGIGRPQAFYKAPPVDRTDLVENHSGNRTQPAPSGPDENFSRVRRVGVLRGDRGHDRDWAVLIAYVVLNDQNRPRLLYLVSDGGIEPHQVDLPAAGNAHVRLELLLLRLRDGADATASASSSIGNHSAAMARSRSALSSASSFKRSLRFRFQQTST